MRAYVGYLSVWIVMTYSTVCNKAFEHMDAPDGMILIPSCEFIMGTDAEAVNPDQYLAHVVYLDAFYIDCSTLIRLKSRIPNMQILSRLVDITIESLGQGKAGALLGTTKSINLYRSFKIVV